MKTTKRTRLERAGWRVGTSADFLRSTPEEQRFVEVKLAGGVRAFRERHGLQRGVRPLVWLCRQRVLDG